ncbi:MAG: ThuA domain-containing protein [Pirellulaceae bacterium]
MPQLCRFWLSLAATGLLTTLLSLGSAVGQEPLNLQLRWQQETSHDSGRFHYRERTEEWPAEQTALIVCDVWDYHSSPNANARLGEFVDRLNDVVEEARRRGVTIIHAPSNCMPAYEDHPARAKAMEAPQAVNLPEEIRQWCYSIPAEERLKYPLDQSDGGSDDDPQRQAEWSKKMAELGRNPKQPWQRQADQVKIDDERDFISDQGDEVWNILESRGIKNVILTGVHANMCVLGRPFGLRRLSQNGKNVVLLRDLTDTMYNPKMWPHVSHFTGNDLIVSHIERLVCPTISSEQLIGGHAFRFAADKRPHVVMVVAEKLYDTARTLPEIAVQPLGKDFRVTVLHADEQQSAGIPGLEFLDEADVLLLSARRRSLPTDQMQRIRRFIAAGKPVVALRTSSHAFALRQGAPPEGHAAWPEFDAEVIGGNYHGHYTDGGRSSIQVVESAKTSKLLNGFEPLPYRPGGDLYKTAPLAEGAELLLQGHLQDSKPEPVAWTFSRADGGKTFYTSLGHPKDFKQPGFVRLLANALHWAIEKK